MARSLDIQSTSRSLTLPGSSSNEGNKREKTRDKKRRGDTNGYKQTREGDLSARQHAAVVALTKLSAVTVPALTRRYYDLRVPSSPGEEIEQR